MSYIEQNLIELKERQILLLKGLIEAKKYEKCKFHLIVFRESYADTGYLLIDIATKKQVFFGRLERYNSFKNLRNINENEIYKNLEIDEKVRKKGTY
jgi:hypothetical protein